MTFDSYKASLKAYRKVEMMTLAIMVAVFASVPLLGKGIVDRIDKVGFDAWVILWLAFLLIAGSIGGCYIVRWAQRVSRAYGVCCPHCRKELAGLSSQVVIATGNCGFCGMRVLDKTLAQSTTSESHA